MESNRANSDPIATRANPVSPITIERAPRGWRLHASVWLPKPVDEIFPFFANARNLERITPPFLKFNVATPEPIDMKAGALIDYKLKVRGIPMKWTSKISHWEPNVRFVDEQIKGPYRRWHHTHAFEAADGGTLAKDIVEYDVPGGPIAHALFVRRDVKSIFAYRGSKLLELFND